MQGGACKGHEGASVSTLDHSPHCSFFFFSLDIVIFCFSNGNNLIIAISQLQTKIYSTCSSEFLIFMDQTTSFLPCPKIFCLKTKCLWAKLLIFSLFIGFMAEGGFYGRALTQRPKSITFLQHPHSGPDTSPFWQNHQKYMFFAKCFCNTITLARILPHSEKIIMIFPD